MPSHSCNGGVEQGCEHSQHQEGQHGAQVQSSKEGGHDVSEEVEVRVAHVPNGLQGLPFPVDVGEPREQHPDQQQPRVQLKPLGHSACDNRQRGAAAGAVRSLADGGEAEGG